MKRQQLFTIFGLALVLSFTNPRGIAIPNHEIALKLVPLKVEKAGNVNSIRLVTNSDHTIMTMLTSTENGAHLVSAIQIGGDLATNQQPHALFKLESYFGMPFWDIASMESGIAAVWTKPGSAISPLGFRRQGSEEINLTGNYSSGVFQNPRFVRGTTTVAITAIANENKGSIIALFHNEVESGQADYMPLPSAGPGTPLDGLLLQQGSGYLLITKLLVSEPRGSERMDLRGESIQPGILRCIQLNAKFQPVSSSMSPINDTNIFEFDADISGNKVFLFATTDNGYIAAETTITQETLRWNISRDVSSHAEFVSPSILAVGNTAFTAVIDPRVTQPPRILIGQY